MSDIEISAVFGDDPVPHMIVKEQCLTARNVWDLSCSCGWAATAKTEHVEDCIQRHQREITRLIPTHRVTKQ